MEFSPDKVLVFIKTLASSGNVAKSARAAGITRQMAYYWKKSYPEFSAAWDDAMAEALDELEEAARKRALEGPTLETVTKEGEVVEYRGAPSDNLAKFLLTVHRYKDAEIHEHQHTHVFKLSDAQLEEIAAKAVSGGQAQKALPPPKLVISGDTPETAPAKVPTYPVGSWTKAGAFLGK